MEQAKYDVFISYSRKDYADEQKNVIPGNEVSKIKAALTEAGITYWFDEEGIYSGDKFTEKIVTNIEASHVFLFLSTKNACESPWTSKEIACADEFGKYIIPVRIDRTPYNKKVMFRIADLSYVDYGKNPEKGCKEIVASVKAFLNEIKASEEQAKAEEKRRKEELERQRKRHAEEMARQEKISKLESEIAALESQLIERKKTVLQKEQELRLAQIDLEDCESKTKNLQIKLGELRLPDKERKAKEAEAKRIAEEKRQAEEQRKAEEQRLAEQRRQEAERRAEEERREEEERKRREEEARARVKTFTVGGVSFDMIRVEGGTFMMGSLDNDPDASVDEKPRHQVTLSDYHIGETQVTQALWEAVMGSNPSHFKGGNRPVEFVSWVDICGKDGTGTDPSCFLYKLNQLTGKQFRLPTEAEWEFAARGGNKSRGYKYSGSNDIDEVAWNRANSNDKTHDVKTKAPNELGLYDMSGNVREWCQDWYGDYSSDAQTNPAGPASGAGRVCRGGGWDYNDLGCRVAYRRSDSPDWRIYGCGLRLAL